MFTLSADTAAGMWVNRREEVGVRHYLLDILNQGHICLVPLIEVKGPSVLEKNRK